MNTVLGIFGINQIRLKTYHSVLPKQHFFLSSMAIKVSSAEEITMLLHLASMIHT